MKRATFSLSLVLVSLATASFADAPIASDDFSSAELSSNWAAAKGTWKTADGKLSGAELESDKHAAVLTYKAMHVDSKVQVSFQLNGSKGFHLSFNHPKGHLFRVIVSEKDVRLNLDKDKKDPASKPISLATAPGKFEQGKSYTMTCETAGDSAKIEFSNGVTLSGSHEALKKKKTGYRLIIKGDGVLFDDFAILSRK